MSTSHQERTEELSKAYREMIDHSFVMIETGWEQITAAADLITAAVDTEKDVTRKNWQAMVDQVQSRNEKLAEIFKDPATFQPSGTAGLKPETKELFDQVIEGEKSQYQSWAEYSAGFEKRQEALLKGFSKGNKKIIETNKEMAKSAAVYSEALIEWSREAAATVSTNNKS